jgi:hypothetical protein
LPAADSIILLAKMIFAAGCVMVRIGTSFETEDVFEEIFDGILLKAGVDRGSG